MDDKSVKFYASCIVEKPMNISFKYHSECLSCIVEKVLQRSCSNRDEILQQRRKKYARFKDSDNGLKALEEQLSI